VAAGLVPLLLHGVAAPEGLDTDAAPTRQVTFSA
jgi:hypothetical protein